MLLIVFANHQVRRRYQSTARRIEVDFGELCFRRSYQSFTTQNLKGLQEIEWWVNQALEQGLLQLELLEHFESSSLLGILRIFTPSNDIGRHAFDILASRKVDWGLEVLKLERPDFSVALKSLVLGRNHEERVHYARPTIHKLYYRRLVNFLCKHLWQDESQNERELAKIADNSIRAACRSWNPKGEYPIFEGESPRPDLNYDDTDETGYQFAFLESALLREVRLRIIVREKRPPTTAPASDPEWLNEASEKEREFLRKAFPLKPVNRLVLLLTIYAEMIPREIAPAIRPGNSQEPGIVLALVRHAWEEMFNSPNGTVS